MQIDWITVAAQIVNFLVLVWLLKRFLYRPVTEAMSARERGIAERLAQAAERQEAAALREAEFGERLAAFEREREQRREQVEREASGEKARLIEAARRDAAEAERGWREGLAREQREFAGALHDELAAAVAFAAGRCLADLADANVEARAIERFVDRLATLDEPARRALAGADALVVATAFELDPGEQARLEATIRDALAPAGSVRFEHAPHLVLGIELRSADTRVTWSVSEYLAEAQRRIGERMAAAQAATYVPAASRARAADA